MAELLSDLVPSWRVYWDEKVQRRKWLLDAYENYLEKIVRGGFPPIFEMRHFATLVGIEELLLAKILANSDRFYRTFYIHKKTGGQREINVPAPTLRQIQRWILDNILVKISAHNCCYGFTPGKSALENAKQHLGQKVVLKMDMADFFPSITLQRGIAIFRQIGYTNRVSYCLASLCFKDGGLPQGGVTSPAISNIVGKRLDLRLSALASGRDLRYTRYADDMTFSGDEISWKFVAAVERIVTDERFAINRKKTRLIGNAESKIITGVSISSGEPKLPRKTVRDIKNEVYNILRNGLDQHAVRRGIYDPIIVERLLGRINFWLQVDPVNPTALNYRTRLLDYQKYLDTNGLGLPAERPDGYGIRSNPF